MCTNDKEEKSNFKVEKAGGQHPDSNDHWQ